MPFDELKIDRSLIHDLLTDQSSAAIVEAVLTLARSMEMTVVAEGIEQQAQLERLAAMGCRRFQGFLLGAPAPVEALFEAPPAACFAPLRG